MTPVTATAPHIHGDHHSHNDHSCHRMSKGRPVRGPGIRCSWFAPLDQDEADLSPGPQLLVQQHVL